MTDKPRTWTDVAYLAVCLFGAAAIIVALAQCSFVMKFRDPHAAPASQSP